VPFKGPKKSQPPLKVKIFIAHPFKWAALWVFPHKNNYIPQHLIVIMRYDTVLRKIPTSDDFANILEILYTS
jgi:hypothetical protein